MKRKDRRLKRKHTPRKRLEYYKSIEKRKANAMQVAMSWVEKPAGVAR